MSDERNGLRVIDGLRQATGTVPLGSSARVPGPPAPPRSVPHHPSARKGSPDLALAVHATEQRLSKLLQDRDRMGRDLHDCVLQSLYAIGLSLDAARRMDDRAPKKAKVQTDHAVEQLNRLIQEIRELIIGLQSDTVREFDFMAELQALAQVYHQVGAMRIDLAVNESVARLLTLDEKQQIALIAREALSNSVRHGKARRAAISLRRAGPMVRFEVTDDGIGFRQTNRARVGYGLSNMEARARQLGGRLELRSQPGRGTDVVIELPIEQPVAVQ